MGRKSGRQDRQDVIALQENVDEVTQIMRKTSLKVLERGERLDDMDAKARRLSEHSALLSQQSRTLHNKTRWAKMKETMSTTRAKVYMGVGGCALVVVIVVVLLVVLVLK